jgi:conjugative relaxase-like TrwC/TraI family protein
MRGRLAERLGISGVATKDIFFALCENRNPVTGKTLTPRLKDDRTVGYDINFHCPKSVSIIHALSKDSHILSAFEKSVYETMLDIQKDAKVRVRTEGKNYDRGSEELVWGEFIHQTARPVDGSMSDPHLHAHCFVFNAAWDADEERFKAAQFRYIKRDMPYYQAVFHKRLSDELIKAGYQIRKTKDSFEIKNVPQPVIDMFSKRTNEIGRVAREKGITDPKELDELGAKTRNRKEKDHTMTELKANWKKQIQALEQREGQMENLPIRFAPSSNERTLSTLQCIDYSLKHCFERASVFQDRRLLATAIQQSIGHKHVHLKDIHTHFASDSRLIHVDDQGKKMVTSKEVLAEEKRMVNLALNSQGKFRPLYVEAPEVKLENQQKAAIEHILTTTNGVSIVTGKAGAGKTTTLQELVPLIEKAGKSVTMVAVSADASRGVLRQEGFQEAETVAKLLYDREMQNKLHHQVLIVDEAPLLGTKNMTALLTLADEYKTRLILVGDTQQHNSVDRGDALRILKTVGGIKSAEISKIYRQKHEHYRKTVEHLSIGDVQSAFEILDDMGAIKTIDPLKPYDELANDYLKTVKSKKSVLVVSPMHDQSEAVTNAIRQKLKDNGFLGKREIEAKRYKNLNLTEAQKSDWRNLKVGHIVQFKQNVRNFRRASIWEVKECSEKGVVIHNEEKIEAQLPCQRSKDYELFEDKMILLAKGDLVRITKNSFVDEKKRLDNGQMLEVQKVSKDGKILLRTFKGKVEYEIDKDFGHLAHAYCITSHASQGKTVDEVLIAQPAATFPATSSKQFYVSVSRGRERVSIYTDDKAQLLEYASKLGDRQSAIELVQKKSSNVSIIEQTIRQRAIAKQQKQTQKVKTKEKSSPRKDRTYEPEI